MEPAYALSSYGAAAFARFATRVKWLACQSVYAFALLKLRRTRFAPPVSGVAAPRVARQGEAWRPGLDLNQDKERCTAPASTLPPPGRGDHYELERRRLPLLPVNPNLSTARESVPCHEGHAPRVVADVLARARCAESGCRQFPDDFVFAVARQPDLGAQLPVIGQRRRD
jgi:hypothetical protein